MKSLGFLFLGMGLGYMSSGSPFFWIPMVIGLFFMVVKAEVKPSRKRRYSKKGDKGDKK